MLLLAASNMNPDALASFKAILESVVYYTVIDKIATNVTERTFASWCKDIRNIVTIEDLDRFVKDTLIPTVNDWKLDNKSNFLRLGLNSMQQYRIKFILGKITAYVDALRLGKTTVDDLTSYMQTAVEIEHIMPQTCADKELYGMNDEDFSVYINRLGNLTRNSINKSIHNDVYANKSKAYQSKFYLTSSLSELVNQYPINRTNDLLVWNKRSIESAKMLYRLSEMIWNVVSCEACLFPLERHHALDIDELVNHTETRLHPLPHLQAPAGVLCPIPSRTGCSRTGQTPGTPGAECC